MKKFVFMLGLLFAVTATANVQAGWFKKALKGVWKVSKAVAKDYDDHSYGHGNGHSYNHGNGHSYGHGNSHKKNKYFKYNKRNRRNRH